MTKKSNKPNFWLLNTFSKTLTTVRLISLAYLTTFLLKCRNLFRTKLPTKPKLTNTKVITKISLNHINKFNVMELFKMFCFLGNCNIRSVVNYLVYFESNWYQCWPNTKFFSLINCLFFTRNICSNIGQIVPHFWQIFQH